ARALPGAAGRPRPAGEAGHRAVAGRTHLATHRRRHPALSGVRRGADAPHRAAPTGHIVVMPLRDFDLASPRVATGLRSGRAVELRAWAAATPLNTSTARSRAPSRLRSRPPAPGPFPADDLVRRAARAHHRG